MSTKYSGGIITKSPVTPAGPYETGAAPGVWTVEQALQYTKQGIWPTAGLQPNYIEDVFSTWLYTGNNTGQSITNGINLSGKGGLVWQKKRSATGAHQLIDTVRGSDYALNTNNTNPQGTGWSPYFGFASNGYTLTSDAGFNTSPQTYVSWTFREQAKFFDVVTYTGDGQNDRQITHNLGSTPGCIIVKCLNFTGSGGPSNWLVYHQSVGITKNLYLNTTAAAFTGNGEFGTPTSTYFVVNQPGGGDTLNANGDQYVAYLFAHNAGGFGLTGTDNVISCGSFTGASSVTVNLGYEPQWILAKLSTGSSNWYIFDVMRGMSYNQGNQLRPDLSNAESDIGQVFTPTATGFTYNGNNLYASGTLIYIAIRRGPMKVPTVGTSVFLPSAVSTDATAITTNFPVDMLFDNQRAGNASNTVTASRLIGSPGLITSSTAAEAAGLVISNCFQSNVSYTPDALGSNVICYAFRRAPSFFDEVCYTGTGSATTFSHNLTVVPEMMIVKSRSGNVNWAIYTASTGATKWMYFGTAGASTVSSIWNDTAPTSSVFTIGSASPVNDSGATYVNYLFATCAGVSKVGSYTGTGATQTINCGFGAGGSRFVLIKRTDSTGDWYVWDSARGMVSGTDPSLLLNSTAAEVNANSIYTISTGFQIVSTAAGINASGGTYIFLSIA